MIEWYKDKELSIFFDNKPQVAMRYALPSMTDTEKKAIAKYPFENKQALKVSLFDHLKQVKREAAESGGQSGSLCPQTRLMPPSKKHEFTIPKNYCWDGATIPRFFWRLIGAKTSAEFLIPSLVHDWMCVYHNSVGYDRNFSSRVFRALLIAAGVGKFKAQVMYLAVDNFQKFCGWQADI